jgi:hypothetical protein
MQYPNPSMILKVGLYTPQDKWTTTHPNRVAAIMANHIDEPTGIYLSPACPIADENHRFQPVWDFDSKHTPQHALNDARGFVEHLAKNGIPPEDLIPFASGRKGIHIASRYLLTPRDNWYAVFNHVASHHWGDRFPTLDAGIYQNRALIRAPWSRHQAHPTARKKPIPWDLFFTGRWAEIEAWAKAPLNDMQWADIETLIRESTPTFEPTPVYWQAFSDALVFDFRHHTLTRRAVAAAMEIPAENVTFALANGQRVTIKVWGNAEAAVAWLSALVSDSLAPAQPFTQLDLQAVCQRYEIEMGVLLTAPTAVAAYCRLFGEAPSTEATVGKEGASEPAPSGSGSG